MKFALLLLCGWLSFHPGLLMAQEEENPEASFNGYLKFLQTINYQDVRDQWLIDNLIHNRLNFKYMPGEHFRFTAELRNRFFYGDFVRTFPGYDSLIGSDNGVVDLSFNIVQGNSFLLNSTIDRLYFDYTAGKWQVRFGRHRINWGQNLVWNPNDVFNAYSYFDFDYEERPGTDALRVQYFTGTTSSAEFIYQLGESLDDMSFMGLYRFNRWGYDLQFLGGTVKTDVVLGTGWSGQIGGGGFRGEITYFHPKEQLDEAEGQLVASISGDYTLPSSLYLHAGFIYNSAGATGKPGTINPGILLETSAKYLTLSRMNLFGQVSYRFTPLLYGSIASIVNPFDGSFFAAPSLTYSIGDNTELLMIAQIFEGEPGSEFGGVGKLLYFRAKWSF
jgi:hypothetical protein